jgi:formamidopyrimidine-DNA glycosylase
VPELPEAEAYRRLAGRAVGRRVAAISTPDLWYLKAGTDRHALEAALVGARALAARRHGKRVLVDVDSGHVLGLQFGMTGTLELDGEAGVDDLRYAPSRRNPGWVRFAVRFVDGGVLAVHDPRRLGGVTLDPDLSQLGPDAIAVRPAVLARALAASGTPVKARLLDQSVIAGIGNLVADEVLWRAAVDPRRPAADLGRAEARRLHRHLAATLADLLARGGSHLGDLGPERRPGGRCPRDGTALARAVVGGRTTWWCPAHQR